MTQWFVQSDEQSLGPLRPAELLALVREGTVVAETMIRKDDSPWFTASEVGGLFEAAHRPTVKHFCPQCGRGVDAPPTQCPKCDVPLTKTRTEIIEHSVGNEKPSDSPEKSGPALSARRWLQRRVKRDQN